MIYSNGSTGLVGFPDAVPLTRPLIRPVEIPLAVGRAYTAYLDAHGRRAASTEDAVWVRVSPRGHWRLGGPGSVRECLGCGARWLVCLLEDVACPKGASAQDVATALLGRTAVAA